MMEFEDYYNSSERFISANTIQETPDVITVHVEATEDKSFWSYILKPYFKSLDFYAFSNKKLRTGKKGLKNLFPETSKSLIICLDSDYDYLFQNLEIIKNPFIFQTYTYATENLKCYAESLQTICTDVTHNPTDKLNFVALLEDYSKIIYELFIWHLYFFSLSNKNKFTDLYETIQIPSKFNINAIDTIIFETLKSRVNSKIDELKQNFPEHITKLNDFSKQLKIVGLEDKNTYLFIQGHTLYDNVVLPLLRAACDNLKVDSIKEINKSSAETEHKNKVRNDYLKLIGNSLGDDEKIDILKLTLSLNKNFKDCFLFKKIEDDIQAYLEILKPSGTHV